jgi:hypothetical protein
MGMNDKHNYDPTKWVDNSEPDIDAEHLNKIESALQEYGVSIDELAAAGGTAAKVKATDTYGLVVSALGESTAQALIDAIANKVMNELINKNKIVNNLLATDASTVLAGTQGAALDKRLVAAENAVAQLNSELSHIGLEIWGGLATSSIADVRTWVMVSSNYIDLVPGSYIIGYKAKVTTKPSVYIDSKVDNASQTLQLYEKSCQIPISSSVDDLTDRSVQNTFMFRIQSAERLYLYFWCVESTSVTCEIWAKRIC